jgi:ABC-type sulfate transport system permease component
MSSNKTPYIIPAIIMAILFFLAYENGQDLGKFLYGFHLQVIESSVSGMLGSFISWHLFMKRRFKKDNLQIDSGALFIGGLYIGFFLAAAKYGLLLTFGGNFYNEFTTGNGLLKVLGFFILSSLFVTYFLRIKLKNIENTDL